MFISFTFYIFNYHFDGIISVNVLLPNIGTDIVMIILLSMLTYCFESFQYANNYLARLIHIAEAMNLRGIISHKCDYYGYYIKNCFNKLSIINL